MHIKHIHEMIEKLSEYAKMELDKNIDCVDTKEMQEVAEIIKELSEAEYYAKISKAMDDSEYGVDYDYMGAYDDSERRGYRGRMRDSKGRFMRRGYKEPPYYHMMPKEDYDNAEYNRDIDRDMGIMYYPNDDSRYTKAKRGYEESKEMHKDNSPESKQHKMKELENYMKELSTDVTNLIADASAEEKAMLKNKMQVLMQKI